MLRSEFAAKLETTIWYLIIRGVTDEDLGEFINKTKRNMKLIGRRYSTDVTIQLFKCNRRSAKL